jgi:hypothetical protein
MGWVCPGVLPERGVTTVCLHVRGTLIDCEEDRTFRAVLVDMLRETDL